MLDQMLLLILIIVINHMSYKTRNELKLEGDNICELQTFIFGLFLFSELCKSVKE